MKFKSGILVLLVASLATVIAHPYTADEYEEFEDICMDLLDPPPAYRQKFKNHQYPDNPITHRHLYCLGVVGGGFDPKLDRLKVDRIYAQYGGDSSLKQFRQKCEKCELRAKETSQDRFEFVYRVYQCFEKQFLGFFEKPKLDAKSCDRLAAVERLCAELF